MINFTQILNDKDYREAIWAHYFSYKYTYTSPVVGGIFFVVILFCLITMPHYFDINLILFLLFAVLFMLRPVFYVQNILRGLRSDKSHLTEMTIEITDDHKLIAKQGESLISMNLSDLYAYYNKGRFIFLYSSRNQYLVLDKKQMTDIQIRDLMNKLVECEIRNR